MFISCVVSRAKQHLVIRWLGRELLGVVLQRSFLNLAFVERRPSSGWHDCRTIGSLLGNRETLNFFLAWLFVNFEKENSIVIA